MKIIFRVDTDQQSGIGHLVRCTHIANALYSYGTKSLFAVNFFNSSIEDFLGVHPFQLITYSIDGVNYEIEDATELAVRNNLSQNDLVIVDSYNLGLQWQKRIKTYQAQLMVIDDLARKGLADILLDIRWRGDATDSFYDSLVPSDCLKLLGPKFIPLANAENNLTGIKSASRVVLLSLGGGGDLTLLKTLAQELLSYFEGGELILRIYLVVGPVALNSIEVETAFYSCDQVTILKGKTDLTPYLDECDLYIGASGGTLYQLRAKNIPAITFSLADNQENDDQFLDDIGHYFHLGPVSVLSTFEICALAQTMLVNYSRVLKMGEAAKVSIDSDGAERVARAILSLPEDTIHSNLGCPAVSQEQAIELSSAYSIRRVVDNDINHYLNSRNLPDNRSNMIDAQAISKVSHYKWWFNAPRESYLLTKNSIPSLYIWHQVITYQADKYLIGGWFVCQKQTSAQCSMVALNWQLETCDEKYPSVPWLAVIDRNNKYVKLMNDYMGFEEIADSHPYFSVLKSCFPNADHTRFHFVIRESVKTI